MWAEQEHSHVNIDREILEASTLIKEWQVTKNAESKKKSLPNTKWTVQYQMIISERNICK